jgi:hypothetical protein
MTEGVFDINSKQRYVKEMSDDEVTAFIAAAREEIN